MDQYSNNSQNDFLWSLLDNPANDAHLYAYNMQRLVNDFPQSGILQALFAHASEEKNLKQASVYFNPRSLFKLINAPSTFVGVPDERIFIQKGISTNGSYNFGQYPPVYNEPLNEFAGDAIDKTDEFHADPHAPVSGSGSETTTQPIDYEPVFNHETDFYHAAAEHVEEPVTAEHEVDENDVRPEGEVAEIPEAIDHEHDAAQADHRVEDIVEDVAPEPEAEVAEPVSHTEEEMHAGNAETGENNTVHEAAADLHDHTAIAENTSADIGHAETTGEEIVAEGDESTETLSEHEAPPVHHEAEEVSSESHEDMEGVSEHEAQPVHDSTDEFSAEQHDQPEVPHKHETPVAHELTETVHAENNEIVQAEAHETDAGHHTDEHFSGPGEVGEETLETITPELEAPVIPEVINEAEIEKELPIAVAEDKEEEKVPEVVATQPVHEHVRPEPEPETGEDETYDEIVGIEDIKFDKHSTGDNFFSFDQEFGAHEDEEESKHAVEATAGHGANGAGGEADHQDVSKYHDEKMPYSFMWWLDKTRKEHAQVYQPYVKPQTPPPAKKVKKVTDELQQQYFENIFHITSVEELDKSTPPVQAPYNTKRKEQVIIERFIKEEPQIKPQSSDKLDNENKAKKSSEDRDELVTETLAGIYSDQMLYHKAISSYKKLMLRFPEKSRYFADKIEQLEKKTN